MNSKKIKVSKEVAEELDYLKNYDKAYLIYHIIKESNWIKNKTPKIFKELGYSQIYDCLHYGYEKKLSPEEEVIKLYENMAEYEFENEDSQELDFHICKMDTIKQVYEMLTGKKIEGELK